MQPVANKLVVEESVPSPSLEESTTDTSPTKFTIDEAWSAIVKSEQARTRFNQRVEYILSQFGTALSCNRFAIGECIEYAANDLLSELGIESNAVSSEKRIDIKIANVTGLLSLSSKFVSTGNHVILYNAQRTTATDMTLHPTILFLMNEWWLLVPDVIERMGLSVKDYMKSTGDSVQLSFELLKQLRARNYPYRLAHKINYNKETCPRKATSELLYEIVKDLLNPVTPPVIRVYLEKKMESLLSRKV